MIRPLIASLMATVALLLSAGPAGAHTGAADPRITAAPGPTTAALASTPRLQTTIRPRVEMGASGLAVTALSIVLAAAVVAASGTSRRRVALVVALLSAAAGVDAAVHSVHHLHDPGAAASCALASGSTHAPAVLTAGTVIAVTPEPTCDGFADPATLSLGVQSTRPDRGRAPPSSSA